MLLKLVLLKKLKMLVLIVKSKTEKDKERKKEINPNYKEERNRQTKRNKRKKSTLINKKIYTSTTPFNIFGLTFSLFKNTLIFNTNNTCNK